jgi:4-hydroxy-4-methyl-2-oxoglutarate aldolase
MTLGIGLDEVLARLRAVQVSSLCDADKTLPVLDPLIRPLLPGTTLVGPARTVVAHDDHLPLLVALRGAGAGSVLVVATDGHRRAVCGELMTGEARRRALSGIVVDGYCRDLRGLRALGLPVFARGLTPMSGTAVDTGTFNFPVVVGGVLVEPGDIVVGDDDGLVVAAPGRLADALPLAEEIERAERELVGGMGAGRSLHAMTNLDEHLRALADGGPSRLEFRV